MPYYYYMYYFKVGENTEYDMLDTGAASNYCSEEWYNNFSDNLEYGSVYFDDDRCTLVVEVGDYHTIPAASQVGIVLRIKGRPYMTDFVRVPGPCDKVVLGIPFMNTCRTS